jgi:hypothetical protein
MQKPGGRRTLGCLQQSWGYLWSFVNLVVAIISILKKYNQRLNKILKKIPIYTKIHLKKLEMVLKE